MIRTIRHAAALLAAFCFLAQSCKKDEPNGEFVFPHYQNSSVDPGIITNACMRLDSSFHVAFPAVKVYEWSKYSIVITTPQEEFDKLIDLHLEVLPLYVFGNENAAGDYYAVTGYVVAHNAEVFETKTLYDADMSNVEMMGWFMDNLCIDTQLLDKDGNAVNNEDVTFFVTPEPSTTIGESTYTKGFSFSFSPSVTFGGVKKTAAGQEPSWKTTALGNVGIGFKWDNSSSQTLPDQSVLMWTEPQDRTVCYDFQTNNVTDGMKPSCVPATFRNDQRVDFSWVWFVKSGAYGAKDYSFENMRMKVVITPKFKTHVDGTCRVHTYEKDDKGEEKEKWYSNPVQDNSISANVAPIELETALPAMNRIPTAMINVKNCTRCYMTNMKVYRAGEYGEQKAYDTVNCVCDTNESVDVLLREGTYDIVYELKNGDTGESKGHFMISGVELGANESKLTTTFEGHEI